MPSPEAPNFQPLASQTEGLIRLPGDEFVEWYKEDQDRSLIWSSELAIASIIRTLRESYGEPEAHIYSLGTRNIKVDHEAPDEVTALGNEEGLVFLRLQLPKDQAFVWSNQARNAAPTSHYAEASLLFDRGEHLELVTQIVRATSTPTIADNADQIVENAAV